LLKSQENIKSPYTEERQSNINSDMIDNNVDISFSPKFSNQGFKQFDFKKEMSKA